MLDFCFGIGDGKILGRLGSGVIGSDLIGGGDNNMVDDYVIFLLVFFRFCSFSFIFVIFLVCISSLLWSDFIDLFRFFINLI